MLQLDYDCSLFKGSLKIVSMIIGRCDQWLEKKLEWSLPLPVSFTAVKQNKNCLKWSGSDNDTLHWILVYLSQRFLSPLPSLRPASLHVQGNSFCGRAGKTMLRWTDYWCYSHLLILLSFFVSGIRKRFEILMKPKIKHYKNISFMFLERRNTRNRNTEVVVWIIFTKWRGTYIREGL